MNMNTNYLSSNVTQIRSILPTISNNSNKIPVNKLIEDYMLHNLTDSQQLTFKPGVVSIDYMGDSNYIGEVSEQQTHIVNNNTNAASQNTGRLFKQGRGVYRYSNNQVYMGDWYDDAFNGLGMYIFSNGNIYKGLFYQGNSTKGILNYANGQVYQGQFKDGLKHGQGIMKYVKQSNQNVQQQLQLQQYNGQWINDKKNGKGILKSKQYTIEGVWQHDKINGQVFIKTNSQLKQNSLFLQYRGLMSDNQLVKGYLKIQYSLNNYYEGQIYQGKFQGKGKYVQCICIGNNNVIYQYQGQFKKGCIQGKGRLKLTNPTSQNIISQYQGIFSNNGCNNNNISNNNISSFDNRGTITYTNGDKYEGIFKYGLKNGIGVYRYKNGDIYQGQFINDRIQGHGRYIWYNTHTTYQGVFTNGTIVQGKGKFNKQTNTNININPQPIPIHPQILIRPTSISPPSRDTNHRYINVTSRKGNNMSIY